MLFIVSIASKQRHSQLRISDRHVTIKALDLALKRRCPEGQLLRQRGDGEFLLQREELSRRPLRQLWRGQNGVV
jgi:hypothetical protein